MMPGDVPRHGTHRSSLEAPLRNGSLTATEQGGSKHAYRKRLYFRRHGILHGHIPDAANILPRASRGKAPLPRLPQGVIVTSRAARGHAVYTPGTIRMSRTTPPANATSAAL